MLDSQVLLPIVGQRLVEGSVLLLLDILGLASPDRLLRVEQLPLLLGDLLLLCLLSLRQRSR